MEKLGIAKRLKELKTEKRELNEEEDLLFDRLHEIADDEVGEMNPYRYTSRDDQWTVGRIIAQNSPRIDEEALEKELSHAQWILVTRQERVLDLPLLELALTRGDVPVEIVQKVSHTPDPTVRKINQTATAGDMKGAAR